MKMRNKMTREGQRWGDFIWKSYCESVGSVTWWPERTSWEPLSFNQFRFSQVDVDQRNAAIASNRILSMADHVTWEKTKALYDIVPKLKTGWFGSKGHFDRIIDIVNSILEELLYL